MLIFRHNHGILYVGSILFGMFMSSVYPTAVTLAEIYIPVTCKLILYTISNTFKTTGYRKSTSRGFCLNADSECINRYKNNVKLSYTNRAEKITKLWEYIHGE